VLGAVNIEASILYKPGLNVNDYLKLAGLSNSSDKENSILLRADGSASTSEGTWLGKSILKSAVMPGDFIIVPQRLDLENDWSFLIRNTKDITQIFYQLGLGAAAIKTLKN
jgi:protein involved in polysaccharide export with SLBB domain